VTDTRFNQEETDFILKALSRITLGLRSDGKVINIMELKDTLGHTQYGEGVLLVLKMDYVTDDPVVVTIRRLGETHPLHSHRCAFVAMFNVQKGQPGERPAGIPKKQVSYQRGQAYYALASDGLQHMVEDSIAYLRFNALPSNAEVLPGE